MVVRFHPVTLETIPMHPGNLRPWSPPLEGGRRSGNGPVPSVNIIDVYERFSPVDPVGGGVKRSRVQFKASPGTEFILDR